jgi:NAD(P)-dependent dehydrogenase (short-subunit alcohol dehydrogenase family)
MLRDVTGIFSLDGKAAIVTGAGSGLGRAIAEGFAQFGARVALLDVDEPAAGAVAEGILGAGGDAAAFGCDVADPADAAAAVGAAVERFGRIDILVANAGISDRAPAVEMSVEQWRRVIDVNLSGAWYTIQAVGRHMIGQGIRGSIVSISSAVGIVGIKTGNANYSASKGGLNALTRLLAIEWAERGIRVNAIAPTHIRTPFIEEKMRLDPAAAAYFLGNIPLGRLGEPEDVVGAALYLASDASSLVTGHVLCVDGGHTV